MADLDMIDMDLWWFIFIVSKQNIFHSKRIISTPPFMANEHDPSTLPFTNVKPGWIDETCEPPAIWSFKMPTNSISNFPWESGEFRLVSQFGTSTKNNGYSSCFFTCFSSCFPNSMCITQFETNLHWVLICTHDQTEHWSRTCGMRRTHSLGMLGYGISSVDSQSVTLSTANAQSNLVGGSNHLEKYESQWEGLSHILWNIKNIPNHQREMHSRK